MAPVTPNSSLAKSLPCQVCTLLLSSDPKAPSLFLPPIPITFLSRLACPRSLAAWEGVGRGTKEWVFFSQRSPSPRLQELRVSLSHLWSKAPSPALPGPTPDILGSAFPWKLGGWGWGRVHVLSLCVWSVFMYLRMCL